MKSYKRRKQVAQVVSGDGDGFTNVSPASASDDDGKDYFYDKLNKLNDSSGLTLIINFRETSLDLYHFYKHVTARGGFHQVSKDGKWGEIATILKINNGNALILTTQLQNVYKIILYPFEQMYNYRTPAKSSPSSTQGSAESPNGLTRENSHCESLYPSVFVSSNDQKTPNQLSKGPETPELKPILQTKMRDMEWKEERGCHKPPLKPRSAYQMYVKLECDRFKSTHGENSLKQKIKEKIIDSWNHLNINDRKPYVEASNKDKERYSLEMAAYKANKSNRSLFCISAESETINRGSWFRSSTPRMIDFGSSSSEVYDDYHVSLQVEDGNEVVPDKSLVESTIEMLKSAKPTDPIFQVGWDYYSP